jgi:uncharacterized protein YegP (UPF0339 family)
MWKFEVYKDQDDGWHWRLVQCNAVIVVDSERFTRRSDAKQAAEAARSEIAKALIDLV